MKNIILISTLALCIAPLALRAESPTNNDEAKPEPSNVPPPPGARPGGPERENRPGAPSREIRERFEAARKKAMEDEKIQELRKKADAAVEEFQKAMREAMLKIDSGLADIIKHSENKMRGGKEGWKHGEFPPGLANLSEGDRQKLMAACEKAKDSPTVQATEAKKKEAKTPEERRAAAEEFRKAMDEAILKADPSLGPVLEKARPPMPPPKEAGKGIH